MNDKSRLTIVFIISIICLTQFGVNANETVASDTLQIKTENIDVRFVKKNESQTKKNAGAEMISIWPITQHSKSIFKAPLPEQIYAEAQKLNEFTFRVYIQFKLTSIGTIENAEIIQASKNLNFNLYMQEHLEELVFGINSSNNPLFFKSFKKDFVLPFDLVYDKNGLQH